MILEDGAAGGIWGKLTKVYKREGDLSTINSVYCWVLSLKRIRRQKQAPKWNIESCPAQKCLDEIKVEMGSRGGDILYH